MLDTPKFELREWLVPLPSVFGPLIAAAVALQW
jgi:hypothetical protein